jgi:hypothetical protein
LIGAQEANIDLLDYYNHNSKYDNVYIDNNNSNNDDNIHNPDMLSPDVHNPDMLNPDMLNPDIHNPDIGSDNTGTPTGVSGVSTGVREVREVRGFSMGGLVLQERFARGLGTNMKSCDDLYYSLVDRMPKKEAGTAVRGPDSAESDVKAPRLVCVYLYLYVFVCVCMFVYIYRIYKYTHYICM